MLFSGARKTMGTEVARRASLVTENRLADIVDHHRKAGGCRFQLQLVKQIESFMKKPQRSSPGFVTWA